MGIKTKIEFTDLAQHTFDQTKIEMLNGEVKLKSQVNPNEILYYNFDAPGAFVSKRGNYTFNLAGSILPTVASGKMNIPNLSTATISNLSISGDFALKFEVRPNFTTIVNERTILELKSNTDQTSYRWYFSNNGGGVTRVTLVIINSSGTVISTTVIGTFTFTGSNEIELSISKNAGNVYHGVNGVVTQKVLGVFGSLASSSIILGRAGQNADFKIDNLQVFSDDLLNQNYTDVFTEKYTYPITAQEVVTNLPLLMDKLLTFEANLQEDNDSEVKFHLIRNVSRYWYNLTNQSWEVQDPALSKYDQSNSFTEINDHVEEFPLVEGIGAYIQIVSMLKASPDGYTTPILDSLEFGYSFYFKPDEVLKCIVYGSIYDNSGNPVEGAIISIESKDYFYNNVLIGPNAKTVTNADGKWDISLVETETKGTSVNFKITYQDADGNTVSKDYKRKIIPNSSTVQFVELEELA